MKQQQRYIKDGHGHVYIYVERFHADRIGHGVEFTTAPEPIGNASPVQKPRSYRTLQELREAAAKIGYDIPDGTPFAKAQNMYAAHLKTSQSDLNALGVFDDVGKQTN